MSHADSKVEFDPVLTSITGDSESGKTNLWRACRLLVMNEDWPEGLVRDQQEEGVIRLEFTEGHKVERTRTAQGQRLKLIDKTGKSQVFAGKKNTGDYLQAFTGFSRVALDEASGEEDLNFIQVGADSLLFVGNYQSIQRRVSAIVGGSRLEDAKNRLAKELRRGRAVLDAALSDEQRLNLSVQSLQLFLQSIEQPTNQLTEIYNQWKQAGDQLQALDKVLYQVIEFQKVTHQLSIYDGEALKECYKLLETLGALEAKQAPLVEALQLLDDWLDILLHGSLLQAEIQEHQQQLEAELATIPICASCGRPL